MDDNIIDLRDTTTSENNQEEIIKPDEKDISILNEYSDFINEDNEKAFKFFNMQSRINDIKKISNDIKDKTHEIIPVEDDLDFFDELVMKYSDGEIEKLTNDEIDNIYSNEEHPIELVFDLSNIDDEYDFKRDFMEFRRKSIISIKALDEETEKLNTELAKSQEELDNIIETYGDMDNLILNTLNKRLDVAKSEDQKKVINDLIKYFNYAFTLDNIKTFIKSYKGRNIIGYYKNDKESRSIYRKYRKMCDIYSINTDLSKFGGLEENIIGKEYNNRPNIVLFTIMYYVSTFYNKNNDKTVGLFLTQFVINLKNLIYDKFSTPEKKEEFMNNIKSIIEIIG